MMKKSLLIVAVVQLVVFAGHGQEKSGLLKNGVPTGIAARVNDDVITWVEVEKEISLLPSKGAEEIKKSILRQLAEKKLFLQEADRLKLTVMDDEVDKAVEKEIKSFGTREKFMEYLNFMKTTETKYRDSKREALLINKMIYVKYREFQDIVLVNYVAPEELQEYYETHKEEFKGKDEAAIRRISLSFANDEQKARMKKEIESIKRHLDEGAVFAYMAMYYSETSPETGGLVTGVKRGEHAFSPEMEQVIFETLKEGECTPIFEERGAFNIVKLEKREKQAEMTYEEAQEIIRNTLQQKRFMENRLKLRNELLKKTYFTPATLFD